MNTTKYEIELPTLPDHLELCGPCIGTEHHYGYDNDRQSWEPLFPELIGKMRYVVARRKRTLADWANDQPLFKALAEARKDHKATELIYASGARWTMINPGHVGGLMGFNLGINPSNLTGKLRLEGVKWVDA